MADSKISALTADTTPTSDDLVVTVNDPAGTPANRKVTLANLATALAGMSGMTSAFQAANSDLTDLVSRWVAASASGSASLDFLEDSDNGTNKVTLAAPSALGGDRSITFPDVAGELAIIDTSAYGSGWNGSTKAPTQDGVYDQMELRSLKSWRQVIRKTADEAVTSSATLQDDDHLLFAIGASEVWCGRAVVFYDGATTGDVLLGLNAPSGATVMIGVLGVGHNSTLDPSETIRSRGRATVGGLGIGIPTASGTLYMGIIEFTVVNSTTAGNVNIQWAQNTSDGTATNVRANSFLVADRIA